MFTVATMNSRISAESSTSWRLLSGRRSAGSWMVSRIMWWYLDRPRYRRHPGGAASGVQDSHLAMKEASSTITRVTLPAATRPRSSWAETVKNSLRPATFSSVASAVTSRPTGLAAT